MMSSRAGRVRGARRGVGLGLAVYVGNSQRPERNEVDAGNKLAEERGRELPVPAEKPSEQSGDAEIEHVVHRRFGSGNEKRKDGELHYVGHDGNDHGGAQARSRPDGNGSASISGLLW